MVKVFRYHLKSLRELVQKLPLDTKVYAEGSNVGQIAFHAAQSSNNFLRAHVLRIPFNREKEKEYGEQHTLEEINKSLDMALQACDLVEKENPDLSQKLLNPFEIKSGNFTIENNLDALTFGAAHLAEHCGELKQVERTTK